MTDTKKELIVGIFVLIGLVLLVVGVFTFGKMSIRSNYYTLKAVFSDVSTLSIGSPVQVGGVKIGRVNKIYLENEKVVVEMLIQKDIKISKRARIIIALKGVMGDMMVSIYNPANANDECNEGDVIKGEDPMNMTLIFEKADELVDKAQETLNILKESGITDNLNATLEASKKLVKDTDKLVNNTDRLVNNINGTVVERINETIARADVVLLKIEDALPEKDKIDSLIDKLDRGVDGVGKEIEGRNKEIKETIVLLNNLLKNVDILIKDTNGIVKDNKDEIASIVENFEKVSQKTLQVVEDIDKNVDTEAVNKSIKDLNEITSEIKGIIKDVKESVKKVDSAGINSSIKNVEKLSSSLDNMMKTKINFYPEIEMSNEFNVKGNFNMELYNKPTNTFLRMGKNDVNENWGKANIIAGKRFDKVDLGLGMVNDKAGFYADYEMNKRVSFSADYYDLKKNNVDLFANYWMKDFKLYLRYDVRESLYGGVGYQF